MSIATRTLYLVTLEVLGTPKNLSDKAILKNIVNYKLKQKVGLDSGSLCPKALAASLPWVNEISKRSTGFMA